MRTGGLEACIALHVAVNVVSFLPLAIADRPEGLASAPCAMTAVGCYTAFVALLARRWSVQDANLWPAICMCKPMPNTSTLCR